MCLACQNGRFAPSLPPSDFLFWKGEVPARRRRGRDADAARTGVPWGKRRSLPGAEQERDQNSRSEGTKMNPSSSPYKFLTAGQEGPLPPTWQLINTLIAADEIKLQRRVTKRRQPTTEMPPVRYQLCPSQGPSLTPPPPAPGFTGFWRNRDIFLLGGSFI